MQPSLIDPVEVLRQSASRARRIAAMEKELEQQRYMRSMDACWLIRNTDLQRQQIAAVLGISRVTLNQYLNDAGMNDEYMATVRKQQQEQGVKLFSPDVSGYLDTGEQG
jgi:hypothetical protein